MKSPRLFAVPAKSPIALTGSEGNILRRVRYALSPDEHEALLEEVSPARFQLGSKTLRALERYTYHRVGPLYPTYNDVSQRDHFLPHTGLWAPVRQFDDVRVMTQLWLHTAAHEWYGWPLPVSTTYERYRQACFEGEVLAVIESEFRFFKDMPKPTEGMFNPAFPSTYEALRSVGIETVEEAHKFLHNAQFNGGRFTHEVYAHPAYKGGTAITLLRQAAWPEHDEQFVLMHWNFQRGLDSHYTRAYNTFWTPDRQEAIRARQAAGNEGLISFVSNKYRTWDEVAGTSAVIQSMIRVMAVDVVQHPVNQAEAHERIYALRERAAHAKDLAELREMALEMPDVYDDILANKGVLLPAPMWKLATDFHSYRVGWEAELQEKTSLWRENRNAQSDQTCR